MDRTSLNCTNSTNIWQTYIIPKNICKVMCKGDYWQRLIYQNYKYISPSTHNFREMTDLRDCTYFPSFTNAGTQLSGYTSSICPLVSGSILIFFCLLSDTFLPPIIAFPIMTTYFEKEKTNKQKPQKQVSMVEWKLHFPGENMLLRVIVSHVRGLIRVQELGRVLNANH